MRSYLKPAQKAEHIGNFLTYPTIFWHFTLGGGGTYPPAPIHEAPAPKTARPTINNFEKWVQAQSQVQRALHPKNVETQVNSKELLLLLT